MRSAQTLPLHHAVALGLLHGPTELLPISSSGHTTLVPWLAGWSYGELDPELRKSFEVALHAGTAAALLLRPPARTRPYNHGDPGALPRGIVAKLGFLSAAMIPPALAGCALGGQIQRRLGTPATIAAGLLAGSGMMIAAELSARARGADSRANRTLSADGDGGDSRAAAGSRDGLVLGLAQALALMPGVSRSGATFAAARTRGFSRRDADRLSWTVGLPVIAGAAVLQSRTLARTSASDGGARGLGLPLAVGTASAFLSTLACANLLDPRRRVRLLPVCAVYRGALAGLVIRRMRDNTCWHAPYPKK